VSRFVVGAIVAALVVAGCSSGDDGPGRAAGKGDRTTTTTASSTSSSAAATTTTPSSCPTVGSTETKDSSRPAVDQLLSDVTTATDGCTDTITFTFQPNAAPMPGYQVEYADPPFSNSAGQAVTPSGTAFLKVRFIPAWIADLSQESAPLTYTGPRTITPTGLHSVRGLALYDASEAVVGWVIGLDGRRPFAVEASPAQVVLRIG
jgi:hypothetical protein